MTLWGKGGGEKKRVAATRLYAVYGHEKKGRGERQKGRGEKKNRLPCLTTTTETETKEGGGEGIQDVVHSSQKKKKKKKKKGGGPIFAVFVFLWGGGRERGPL